MFTDNLKAGLINIINRMFETPVIKEKEKPAPKTYTKSLETTVPKIVHRSSTFFCDKCGWCDDITTPVEQKITKTASGQTETSYYHPSIEPISCPQCAAVSARPLVSGNHHFAIKYLLKAFQ